MRPSPIRIGREPALEEHSTGEMEQVRVTAKGLFGNGLVYLVIGAVVYGLIYYFILAKKGGGYNPYNYDSSNSGQPNPVYK